MSSASKLTVDDAFDWSSMADYSASNTAADCGSEQEEENTRVQRKSSTKEDIWAPDSSEKTISFNPCDSKYLELQTVYDCEQLISRWPNSSKAWLLYVIFHLKQAEVERARSVAEKALKTISFREEKEKYNVWIALLNLENMYGTKETLNNVLNRAVTFNEPVNIYKHLLEIYVQAEKTEEAEQLFQQVLKKYKHDKEIWIKYCIFYMKLNKFADARKVMERSFMSLPRKDHADVKAKVAYMEFTCGDTEKGRTMFEDIISNYPKRKDLKAIYIELLKKTNNEEYAKILMS